MYRDFPKGFSFRITAKDKKTNARTGVLKTPHGIIRTPAFIPVATNAALKGLTLREAKAAGAEVLMINAYHMRLRGLDSVKKAGGLHAFMNWSRPLMTDSGGFQVFSLGAANDSEERLNKFTSAKLVKEFSTQIKTGSRLKPAKIDDQGVTFFSSIDGKELRLDPKISIQIQKTLGADLIVTFDDHESPLWGYRQTKESLIRSHRWGIESLRAQKRADQLMYGVVHGGRFKALREESARFVDEYFPAIAVGGAYGSRKLLYDVLDWTMPHCSERKPRHLLGIGEVEDIFEAVSRGIDLFDCVMPTRLARHKAALTRGGKIAIGRENQLFTRGPIDPGCRCETCANHSLAYVSHLARRGEISATNLLAAHNISFMLTLMREIQEHVAHGDFARFKKEFLKKYNG